MDVLTGFFAVTLGHHWNSLLPSQLTTAVLSAKEQDTNFSEPLFKPTGSKDLKLKRKMFWCSFTLGLASYNLVTRLLYEAGYTFSVL